MTAKQKAAREKFKKVVTEAAKLRKKNPSLTQAQAVKQAFAISYSKGGQTKKVGAVKKKAAPKKKAALKKAAPKKVASKRITDIHKDNKSHNVNIRVVSGVNKGINKSMLGLLKEYIAVYNFPNGSSDYEMFKATSLAEAKKFAQFHKRRENIKGKVSVKLIKK
jgi:hypothetical protein